MYYCIQSFASADLLFLAFLSPSFLIEILSPSLSLLFPFLFPSLSLLFLFLLSPFLFPFLLPSIFSQEDIKLKPKEVKQIRLGLGFIMSEGVVLFALANSLKNKRCSLQNEVSLEDAEDIVITLTNNSNEIVDIQDHKLLCRVCYKKL